MSRLGRRRSIYDSTGLEPLEEQQTVKVRRGKHKGETGRLQYIRRTTGHVRLWVTFADCHGSTESGTWLAPRSVEVVY